MLRIDNASPLRLFLVFARLSPASFGGGYAMVPAILEEVRRRGWLDEAETGDLIAVAGSAPGGVGVNAAAAVGFRLCGWAGAAAAVLGIAWPAMLIALALGLGYAQLQGHPKIEAAMRGFDGAVLALMAFAGFQMARAALFDAVTAALFVGAAAALFAGVHPALVLAAGIVFGVAAVASGRWKGRAVRTERPRPARAPAELEYYI